MFVPTFKATVYVELVGA